MVRRRKGTIDAAHLDVVKVLRPGGCGHFCARSRRLRAIACYTLSIGSRNLRPTLWRAQTIPETVPGKRAWLRYRRWSPTSASASLLTENRCTWRAFRGGARVRREVERVTL